MTPTFYLRFIERLVPASEHPEKCVRILQQWWSTLDYIPIDGAPDGCIGEWRDVPLETP